MSNSALDHQPFGNHYLRYKMQPIALFVVCEWDFIQGCIAKYILRQDAKNGREDIEKAIHYCELAEDMGLSIPISISAPHKAIIDTFVRVNGLYESVKHILYAIDGRSMGYAKSLISKYYNI